MTHSCLCDLANINQFDQYRPRFNHLDSYAVDITIDQHHDNTETNRYRFDRSIVSAKSGTVSSSVRSWCFSEGYTLVNPATITGKNQELRLRLSMKMKAVSLAA